MKRTTYIMIGMLTLGLVLLVAGIFYASVKGDNQMNANRIFFPDSTVMNASGVRSVRFVFEKPEGIGTFRLGTLQVKPSKDGQGRFVYPKDASKYFNVRREAETLWVVFNSDSIWRSVRESHSELLVHDFHFELEADTALVKIDNDVMSTTLSGLALDSLNVFASCHVQVDSCNLRAMDLFVRNGGMDIRHSAICDLYLDLDGLHQWSIGNSDIGTEYLTGEGSHSNDLQKGECSRVVWIPKNENAELRLNLKEGATVVVDK